MIGAIIFGIIVVVQFVVVTKGATRVSEVAARFALDGMPGRQMAIDADLSAGLIDQQRGKSSPRIAYDPSGFLWRDGRGQQICPR